MHPHGRPSVASASCDRSPAPESEPQVNLDGAYTMTVPNSGFEGTDPKEYLPSTFGGDWEMVIDGTTYRVEGDNFNRISGRIVATTDTVRFEDFPAPAVPSIASRRTARECSRARRAPGSIPSSSPRGP